MVTVYSTFHPISYGPRVISRSKCLSRQRGMSICAGWRAHPPTAFVRAALIPGTDRRGSSNLLALEAYCAGAPIIRVVQHPFWTQLMRQWDDGFLIYDMMDDHSGFLGNGAWLPQQEQELLTAADLVTVAADMLATKARDSKACVIIKNAADRDHFVTVGLRPSGEVPVRVGYYGAISHWFDSGLVSESAKAHPEWSSSWSAPLSRPICRTSVPFQMW